LAEDRSLAQNLSLALRLGALVGIAFTLVEALAGPSPTAIAVARRAAEGVALGALSGLGLAVALVFSGVAGWRTPSPLLPNRLAAALITFWVALTALRHLQRASLPSLVASETTWILSAIGSVLLLLLVWHALLWLADETRRRMAGLGQPLRGLRRLGWAVLGLGAFGLLVLVPEPRQDSRSPDATKTSHRRKEVFLRSPGLGSQVLLKVGREVRTVGAITGPTDLDYAVDGARRVELAWGTADSSGEAHFRAIVRLPDGRKTVLLDERVQSSGDAEPRWFSRLITLPAGTEAGTVVLRTRGTSQTSFWAAPVFSGRHGPKTRRNVIVVSLDTVRADHLNAYGYTRRRTSPELDAWAGEGTLFENAASTAPGTLSSQMSVLTGRYPSSHGVSYANWRVSARIPVLPVETVTLAEVLSAQGFVTAAFTGSGYFALPLGYSRGFGAFVSTNDESLGSAASVFEKAFVWLDRYRDDPFFLFLHTYEAHEPYLDQRFVYEESLGAQDPRARNEALYDGDIRRADAYVGALRRRLEQLGLTDRTLVVIVSDHGEEFDDHFGVWNDGHGHSLYQEQVHVPLVFVGPRVQRRRVDHAVDLTAVAPTVLDFLDVEHPEGMDGRSLLGLLRGQQPSGEEDWLAFSEDVWIGPETRAIRTRDWKLIEQGDDLPERFVENERRRAIHKKIGQLSARMLFHLKADPREQTNRLADQIEMADGLRGRLQKRLASRARASPEGEIQVEGEALDRLRALGYVQ
jgi:arylsulfatase A-like enzyme